MFGNHKTTISKTASDTLQLNGFPSVAYRVYENLWIGNAPQIGSPLSRYFGALILCAEEYQLHQDLFGSGIQVIGAPLHDNYDFMSRADMEVAVRAGGCTARLLREGRSVLVTCMAGRNRSGLICALALCVGPARMDQDEAVFTVRSARGPEALQNPQFLAFLKSYIGHLNSVSSSTELSLQNL